MWDRLLLELQKYPSAVLTAFDGDGYPVSVRCVPVVDGPRQKLQVAVPGGLDMQPGPANLVCHAHDEELTMAKLRTFGVRGVLEKEGERWTFAPKQLLGLTDGPFAAFQMMRSTSRSAKEYLRRRGLSRPAIPWDEIHAIHAEAEAERAERKT